MKKPSLTAVDAKSMAEDKEMQAFYHDLEVDVLARTIWGEARGEGDHGMQAVASVVMNRVVIARDKGKYWWGNTVIQVCQKPYQFSCWNRSDPNFKVLQAVDDTDLYFVTARRLAHRAVLGVLDDVTGGATHYHTATSAPYWSKKEKPIMTIGAHIFYRIV